MAEEAKKGEAVEPKEATDSPRGQNGGDSVFQTNAGTNSTDEAKGDKNRDEDDAPKRKSTEKSRLKSVLVSSESESDSDSAGILDGAGKKPSMASLFGESDESDSDSDKELPPNKEASHKKDSSKIDDSEAETSAGASTQGGDENERKKPTMSSLFGESEDSDDEEEFDDGAVKHGVRPLSPARRDSRPAADEDSIDGHIDIISVPDYPRPAEGTKLVVAKLPNILGIARAPFDRREYNPEDEEEYKNYIRWRYKRDGSGKILRDEKGLPVRESNARLVRWSDGSLQLLIGSEVLDAVEQPVYNSFVHVNETSIAPSGRTQTCLECRGRLDGKIVFRPSSLSSKAHRNLTLAVRKKHFKGTKLIETNVIRDPEREKEARAKIYEDKIRLQARKRQQEDYEVDRRPRRMDESFLEEGYDEDEIEYDEEDISSIKAQYGSGKGPARREKRGIPPRREISSEKEDRRRLPTAKSIFADSDEDSDQGSEGGREQAEDEEEEEEAEFAQASKKRRRVLDEDSD